MNRQLWVGLVLLGGCSSYEMAATPNGAEDVNEIEASFRVDVTPPDALRADRAFAPQTFSGLSPGSNYSLGLSPTVSVGGVVTFYEVTPSAELPGTADFAVGMQVELSQQNTLQSANTLVDTSGEFEVLVVPGLYSLRFLSSDPRIPSRALQIDTDLEQDLEIDLGYGLPVWGMASRPDGSPLINGLVQAVSEDGLWSGTAVTDSQGVYLLRVDPGTYTVFSLGTDDGRIPTLQSEEIAVETEGARVDFHYPALTYSAVALRLEDDAGEPIDAATVRFRSLSLASYGDNASLVVEDSSSNGNINALMLPGEYAVDIYPSGETPSASLSTTLTVDTSFVDMPEAVLLPFQTFSQHVMDAEGETVPGALVVAREPGSGRSWSFTADDFGAVNLLLPPGPLEITLTPPADRPDLPVTHQFGDSLDSDVGLTFAEGVPLEGEIVYPSEDDLLPVEYAVVDVLNSAGQRIGSALTDGDGRFSITVSE